MNTFRALFFSSVVSLPIGDLAHAQTVNLGERPALPVAADILPNAESPALAPKGKTPDFQSFWVVQDYAVRAAVTAGILFDDNIYARSTNKIGDRIVTI